MKTNFPFLWLPLLAFMLTPSAALDAQTPGTNTAPLIAIFYPTNGARFIAPADLNEAAILNDPDERVDHVDFLANTNLLGSNPVSWVPRPRPHRLDRVVKRWLFVPVGEYTLTAVARAASGEALGTSAPVRIIVEFSCEQGVVITPRVSGTVHNAPELGGVFTDPSNDPVPQLEALAADYFRTTSENRWFRRGFAEYAIPVLAIPFSNAKLVLIMPPSQLGDVFDLSYYAADLAITTNDFDQPAIPLISFQLPLGQEEQALLVDVTSLVTQFEGTNLGFRIKLAVDPAFDEFGQQGTGFSPPRLVLNTCSNPPPRVRVAAVDPFASERRPGRDQATFVVWHNGPTNFPLTVYYSLGGSAANGVDYQTLPGALTIPAGRRFARVMVNPLDDTLVESTESVLLNLQLTPPLIDAPPPTAYDPPGRISLPPPYLLSPYRRASAFILDNDSWRWQWLRPRR